jgi:hypothetical protein
LTTHEEMYCKVRFNLLSLFPRVDGIGETHEKLNKLWFPARFAELPQLLFLLGILWFRCRFTLGSGVEGLHEDIVVATPE